MSVRGSAVVVRELGRLSVEELNFGAPGLNEVRLKVHACGLCHSDVSGLSGKIPNPLPMVLGHEGAGVVEAVGPGVDKWKVGDRAILTLVMPCNQCEHCLGGNPSRCANKHWPSDKVTDDTGKKFWGFTGLGCMADYCVVSKNALIPVVEDMPLEKGALVSCGVTTGAGAAMNRAKVHAGASCCVVGCGGVGLSAIQGSRICGARQIIAVDTVPSKLEAAKRFGATHVVNAKSVPDVAKAVRTLTNGGTDYGFEAIGLPATLESVIGSVKTGGTAVLIGVGNPKDEIKFKMNVLLGEKNITGSMMGSSVPSSFVPRLVDFYKKGDLLLDEMISKYYKLAEAYAAFDDLANGSNLRGVFVMHDLGHLVSQPARTGGKL